MTQPIPAGFHTLTPHLIVADGAAAIEFYKKAFGAHEDTRLTTPDGKTVMHAQLTIGNSVLMLGSEFPPNALSPKSRGGTGVFLHLYVPDADAAFDRAVQAGCVIRMPMSDTFWATATAWWKIYPAINGPSPRASTTSPKSRSPRTRRNSSPRCQKYKSASRRMKIAFPLGNWQ